MNLFKHKKLRSDEELSRGNLLFLLCLNSGLLSYIHVVLVQIIRNKCTVEPLYNEVLGTMKITLLYQVSHYIRVKKQRNIKS